MSGTSGGSNILRGGKRAYDCKTLVGNFVEEAYRPGAIKATWGGGAQYETTTQSQMLSGVGGSTTTFGSGLKKQEDPKFDYQQIVNADKTRPAATWSSLQQSAFNNSSKPTEFAAPREMKGRRMTEDELQQYRQRWSCENEDMTKMRYITETTATTDKLVKPHFRKELVKPTQVSFK